MSTPLIDEGHAALLRGDASAAREAFEAALDAAASGDALNGLAEAAYIDHDYDSAIEFYERAYVAYRDEGNNTMAVQAASKLGWLNGSYRGDAAVMQGWIARAQTLVGSEDVVGRGWVDYFRGMFAPDGPEREAHLQSAIDIGRRFDDADLEAAALSQLGCTLVRIDRFEEGMLLLDEALAAAASGEAKDSSVLEIVFCQLFSACEHAKDVVRAEQWKRVGEEIAKQRRLPGVAAWCRTHYGAILTAAGRWPEANVELTEAVRLWGSNFASMRWTALVRLADLRVRQGRFEEADQLLEGLDIYAEAARPLAAMHLARGDSALAAEVLERALERIDTDVSAAAPLWALLVDVHLEREHLEAADEAANHLEAIARNRSTPYLSASAALARGQVCLASRSGDPLSCLRAALSGFAEAQTPMELASARLALARASAAQRPEVAIAEARSALEAFERLEAARQADAAGALLRTLGAPIRTGPKGLGSLTKRESEVLELVGAGLSNPEIGDRLYITRKTVEHHVGSILSKLGLRNRAEAAAFAAREKIS